MDIDAPPLDASLPTDALSAFGLRYPLPFRILFLSSLTLLGFASNLHILSHLGIDTALVLDVRLDAPPSILPRSVPLSSPSGAPSTSTAHPPYVHPSKLYPPLYSLAVAGLGWTAAGWLFFRLLTGGDPAAGERWRIEPAALLILAAAVICWPGNVLCRRERFRFLRCVASPPLGNPQADPSPSQVYPTHRLALAQRRRSFLRHYSRRYPHIVGQSPRRRLGRSLHPL